MNKLQKNVCKALFRPNCYLLFSATQKPMKETLGDFRVKPHISFLYDGGKFAAEWEPEHGPIKVWSKSEKGNEDVKEHYYYDFVFDMPADYSQLAVDNLQLPHAAESGDYNYIFEVLKEWADR